VRRVIHERLAHDPRAGKRLAGVRDARSGRPLWSLRAGDYRIVYAFSDSELWVLVVRVGHRSGVYGDL
jgi:mRNA-degrading endonuclease RelE of RelBE toxin-antitoxin system